MKPILVAIVFLAPCFCFAQQKSDDYNIYSEYFRIFQHQRGGEYNFIVRVAPDYGPSKDGSDLSAVLQDFRVYLKGDKAAGSYFLHCAQFRDTVNKDTLWFPLITQLNKSFRKKHILKNTFSKDLHVSMFTYSQDVECFENKTIEDGWANFHEDFPGHSILTDVSEIASDGKRAVFYFSWRCGGLCGDGSLVMFYKDSSGWRYVCSIILWQT